MIKYKVLFRNPWQEVYFVPCSFVVVLMLGGGDCASQGLNERGCAEIRPSKRQYSSPSCMFLHCGSGESGRSSFHVFTLVCRHQTCAGCSAAAARGPEVCELQKQQGCIYIKKAEQRRKKLQSTLMLFKCSF